MAWHAAVVVANGEYMDLLPMTPTHLWIAKERVHFAFVPLPPSLLPLLVKRKNNVVGTLPGRGSATVP